MYQVLIGHWKGIGVGVDTATSVVKQTISRLVNKRHATIMTRASELIQNQCQGNKEQKLFKSFPNTTFQPSNCYLFLIHNNLMAKLVIS